MPKKPKCPDKIPRELSNYWLTEVGFYLRGEERPSEDAMQYAADVLLAIAEGKSIEAATNRKRGRSSDEAAFKAYLLVSQLIASEKAKSLAEAYRLASKQLGYSENSGPREIERYCKLILGRTKFVFPEDLRKMRNQGTGEIS